MEYTIDYVMEDGAGPIRSNGRIERMRREKQRQMRRRRMIKKYLCLGAGFFAVIAVMVMVVGMFTGKPGDSEAQLSSDIQAESGGLQPTAGTMVQGGWLQSAAGTEVQGGEQQLTAGAEAQGSKLQSAAGAEAQSEGFQSAAGTKPGSQALRPTTAGALGPVEESFYHFEATSDTALITSEEVISSNAILVDESANQIVASKGERERISPASMTKVLTILVAAEHITREQLDDTFTMTREITDYGFINGCSEVGFLEGEEVKVRDLFYGTVLESGSDAALGLACYVAGSHEAFVEMMNQKLEELGLADSAHFTNCVGIYDEEHYCTVYDMAVIMKAALQNTLCREYLSARTYTTTPTAEHPEGIDISNWFIRRIEDKDTGGEVVCAKTGYVDESGSCAVSYGYFGDDTPYICVTADSTTSWRCIYDHVEIYNRYVPG